MPRAAGRRGRARAATGVELAKLCSRVENDWVGAQTGLLDQLASLCSEPGHAVRIDFASLELEPVPLELGGWTLVTLDSGADALDRRLRLQRAPPRVPRGVRGARRSARCARRAGRPRRPARAAARPRPPRASPRTPASTRRSPRCAPATSRRSGACSTPRTPACATTTRRRCPRSSAPSSGSRRRARRARGWSAAASAAPCWRYCGPGVAVPAGALVVAPGPPAGLALRPSSSDSGRVSAQAIISSPKTSIPRPGPQVDVHAGGLVDLLLAVEQAEHGQQERRRR